MPKIVAVSLSILFIIALPFVCGSNSISPAEAKAPASEVPSVQEVMEYEPGPDTLQLDAVFIKGESKSALMRLRASKGKAQEGNSTAMTVKEGDAVQDYRVVKIESRRVLLKKEGKTFVVSLFDGKKSSSSGAKLPPAPTESTPAMKNEMDTSDSPAMSVPDESMPAEGFAQGHESVDDPEMPPPGVPVPTSEDNSFLMEVEDSQEPKVYDAEMQ